MRKSSAPHSKYHILFTVLLAAMIFTGSIAVIISSVAANRYWNDSHLQNAVSDLKEFDEFIVENDSALNKTEAIVKKCNEKATPVREELSPFLEECDRMIIKCFQDAYGVDVTEKLNALHVMESAYLEDISQMVGGSYSGSFPDKLFLNKAVTDSFISDMENGERPEVTGTGFSIKMLRTVYIHEVMHYLGFNSDSEFDHFTEAIAEYLNKKVMLQNGIKYEGITGYASIQNYAAQIAECDPEFIREVLSTGSSHMGERFNSKLGNQSDINYAAYYDKLIGLIQKDSGRNLDRIVYYAQYLTYEYCKAANDNAREVLKAGKENTVSFFEIKWFFNIY